MDAGHVAVLDILNLPIVVQLRLILADWSIISARVRLLVCQVRLVLQAPFEIADVSDRRVDGLLRLSTDRLCREVLRAGGRLGRADVPDGKLLS